MTPILAFVAAHMGYLWAQARYRLLGSTPGSNTGTASIAVESEHLRLRITRAGGELSVEFQSTHAADAGEWVPLDIVQTLVAGQPDRSSSLGIVNADFIGANLTAIEELFDLDQWPATRRLVDEYRAVLPPKRFQRP